MSLITENLPVGEYKNWNGSGVALWWLGQAGFLIRYGKTTLLIDAYLSNILAGKHSDPFSHERMMAPPIDMRALEGINYSLSSHIHGDHLDPGLIPVLKEVSPDCRFVLPEAIGDSALGLGIPENRLLGVNAGDTVSLGEDVALTAIPAAHEVITQDSEERHFFLGYILKMGEFRIYHSGDCLPYEGFDQWLHPFNIDLALLPVNSRKDELSNQGFAGNFSAEQACRIMKDHNFSFMIPHHFGMFAFNTISREELNSAIAASGMPERIYPPQPGILYRLVRDS